MKRETWKKIEALWDEACGLSGARLEGFLQAVDDQEVAAELRSMLEHAGTGGLLQDAVGTAEDDDPLLGRELGAYRIVERIGEGGMGRVYLAERADEHFYRRVAVKVLRASPRRGLTEHFLAERQILADLDHAHVARLLDGGTTPDGQPYLVMEHVQGEPITAYCRRHRLGIGERLRLFRQLCDAVHDAHRHLVVHRDLKPSNVLVTADGQIKLLDFGVAKLLRGGALGDAAGTWNPTVSPGERDPENTLHALTPSYASPEQLHGEAVTTASDIYSLGVLLCELLTGRRPVDLEPAAEGETALRLPSVMVAKLGSLGLPEGALPLPPA
ncbi:MAG: serine/threonine protein kinase, partial [Acidobacteria bacterium]|nr:serine/threonine protein kinase [Acidobacteriota bacterium]